MKKYVKITLFGIILWTLCFAAGFVIWPIQSSNLMLFKTIMIVFSSLSGMALLIIYFNKVQSDYLKESVIVGTVWFVINIVLDLLVLVFMLGTPFGQYFIEVGLRYLNAPIMAIGIGFLLSKKMK